MFIGRTNELNTLNRLYSSKKFEFIVMYGRRRVGKTTIINEFIKNKKAIYFIGIESNLQQNLANFSCSILEYQSSIMASNSFSSFQDALDYVFQLAQKERLILVIDEYPYVAREVKSLASTLQMLIDKYHDKSKLMLILCGSSMSYIEDNILAYKSPLYGRRTAQMKILPFDFSDFCKFFHNFNDEDLMTAYGLVGGTPQYLLQLDDNLSIADNIKNTFLSPSSILFEEPQNLLKQEVRDVALYNAIITAIATGASRMVEISTKVGESTSVCSNYLKNLIDLGIIKKEQPYGEKESRKSIYSLEDNMFRFWYRFIPENNAAITRGITDLAYKRISPHLSTYLGKIFEDVCHQYLYKRLLNGDFAVDFKDLGRWWGSDPCTKSQIEIDIMGQQDKETALFCECKWTNEKVDVAILDKLIERSSLFNYHYTHLCLFAKTGFSANCINKAKSIGNVELITYANMIELFKC